MDTKAALNPASDENSYNYVIFDHFSKSTVTVRTPKYKAQYAVNALIRHWISKIGPPQSLNTDRGTEDLLYEMAN